MSYRSEQRMRKAAILVTSLDRQCAGQIREGLSAADTAALERAIAGLGPIDLEERNDVLHEFRLSTASATRGSGGIEVDWSTSNTAGPNRPSRPDQQADLTRDATPEMQDEPARPGRRGPADEYDSFGFLHEAKPSIVAKLLAGEHPQTSAAVLAQLPAPLASQLLSSMPATCQVDILERLATPHPVDPQAMRIIQDHLADWLEEHRQQTARLSQGSEMVRHILSHTSGQHRRKLLSQLGKEGSRLADLATPLPADTAWPKEQEAQDAKQTSQPHEAPVTYTTCADMADLEAIDPRSLLEAIEQIDPQIAQLALVGAPKRLLDRIAAQLPRRQAKRLKQSLRTIEPTRLSDMLAAQHEFSKRVLQLAALQAEPPSTTGASTQPSNCSYAGASLKCPHPTVATLARAWDSQG